MLAPALCALVVMSQLDPAAEPEAPRFELWTEPVSLGAFGVLSALGHDNTAMVVPLGFEHTLSGPWAVHIELSWLYAANKWGGYRTNGFLAALGLQWRFARAGRFTLFLEPRLVGGGMHQSLKGPAPSRFCDDECFIDTTAQELGFGLVFGVSAVFHGLYWSGVIGGQVTWFSGTDQSLVGLTMLTLGDGVEGTNSGWAITPNLTLVRLGVAF